MTISVDICELMKSGAYADGTTGSGKSDVLMYIADQLMAEGIIVIVFDGTQDWMKRSNITNVLHLRSPLRQTQITLNCHSLVYDISQLTPLDRQRLVEKFCQVIYYHQANMPEEMRRQYFIVFEEAQTYFPQGCLTSKRLQNTMLVLTEGRNYKIRFGAITQFPSQVDKKAIRYMKIRFFGFTAEPNDVAYHKGFIGEKAEELKTLKAGEFMYSRPDRHILKPIQITPHARSQPLAEPTLPSQPVAQPAKPTGTTGAVGVIIAIFVMGILLGALIVSHLF